jgi:hypothetical protein
LREKGLVFVVTVVSMAVELAAHLAAHLAVLTCPSDDTLKSEQSFPDSDNPGSSEQSLDFFFNYLLVLLAAQVYHWSVCPFLVTLAMVVSIP